MNQNIKPLTAFFIIFIAVSLIGLIFWLRGESLNVGGPDQIKLDLEGNMIVHMADKLVKLSPDLELLKEYDLADLGVYDLVGDFDFFSNGDILIRRGKYQPGLFESIFRYFRKVDTKLPIAGRENEGLFRCKLNLNQCSAFGASALDFDSAFHLSIDATDTIYLSDTSRHKLRKFDAQGHELAVIDKGVKFPNQNFLYNGKLWVADTNHHTIQMVEKRTDNFGMILESHSILHPALKNNTWPYSFAKVGENWWVNNLNGSMSDGKIAVYDQNWHFVKIVELPQNADPFDFAVLKEQVLLSDLNNNRFYQLDYQGELVNGSLPQDILFKLDALHQQRTNYINLSYGAVGLFIVFLTGGFSLAIIQARTQEDCEKGSLVAALPIDINDLRIQWISLNKKKERALKIGLVALLSIPMLSLWVMQEHNNISLTYSMFLILLMVVVLLVGRRLFTQKIGTLDDVLIIKKSKKEYAASKANGIYYSDTQILIGDVYVTFNQHQMFYDVEQVVKQLMPILKDATYIQSGQMMNRVIKRQKPAIIILVFFVAILSAGFVMWDGIRQ